MSNTAMKQKIHNRLNLLLIATSEQSTTMDTIIDLFLFLLRYSFMLNGATKPQNSCDQKTPQLNAPQGNIYMGARYLDPKYSRWISVDPALGEYVPGAGKSDEADKLPGMGGVFNSVNLSLFHYAGNNPVRYVDPDGNLIVAVAGVEQAGCGTGEAGAGGVFFCWGKNGFSVGLYATASGGAFFGVAASGGAEVTFAFFADEFSDIEGYSLSAGDSAKFGPGGSLGVELGFNPKAKTVQEKIQSSTLTISYTWGTSPLPEGHIYNNYTFKLLERFPGNSQKSEEINKKVMEYYNNGDYEGLHKYVQEMSKDLLNENK